MFGNAKNSPKSRGIPDLELRAKRIEDFITWGNVEPTRFEELVGKDQWQFYWEKLDAIHQEMKEAQTIAERTRNKIIETLRQK